MLALIPLLPFLGFVVNSTMGRRLPKGVSGGLASLAMLAILWYVEGRGALAPGRARLRLWLYGSLGFAGFSILGFLGLARSRPEHAAIIVALMPLITALMNWLLPSSVILLERVPRSQRYLLDRRLVNDAYASRYATSARNTSASARARRESASGLSDTKLTPAGVAGSIRRAK